MQTSLPQGDREPASQPRQALAQTLPFWAGGVPATLLTVPSVAEQRPWCDLSLRHSRGPQQLLGEPQGKAGLGAVEFASWLGIQASELEEG